MELYSQTISLNKLANANTQINVFQNKMMNINLVFKSTPFKVYESAFVSY